MLRVLGAGYDRRRRNQALAPRRWIRDKQKDRIDSLNSSHHAPGPTGIGRRHSSDAGRHVLLPGSIRRLLMRRNVLVIAASTVLLCLASATTAAAYNNFDNIPCKWPYSGGYSQLTLYYSNAASPNTPSGDYASAPSAARTSWFNTSTPASFSFSGSSTSTHGVYALGSGAGLGVTATYCSGSTTVQDVVKLNSSTLGSGSYSAIFWKQFTAAHEQGHHINLGHSNHLPAIMQSPAPSNPATFPTDPFPNGNYNGPVADDECGVNHSYPSTQWPATCGY